MAEEDNGVNVEKLQESIKKLEANNADLKKERNKFKEAAEKYASVDIDSLQKAAEKLAKLENDKLEQDGEYKKLYDNLQQQFSQEVTKLKQEKSEVLTSLEKEIKTNALNNALVGVKVDPVLLEVASGSLINSVNLVDGTPMVNGQPVTDFVKEWAEGEVGKRFIPAGNSGGGSKGNDGGGVQAEAAWFDPKSSEFNRTKQGQLRRSNPELAEKLAKRFANK